MDTVEESTPGAMVLSIRAPVAWRLLPQRFCEGSGGTYHGRIWRRVETNDMEVFPMHLKSSVLRMQPLTAVPFSDHNGPVVTGV